MIDHAMQFVDKVLFEIGESNFRSRRAIEKIGATLIRSEPLDGKPHVVYQIQKVYEVYSENSEVNASDFEML